MTENNFKHLVNENRVARLTILVDPSKKKAFEKLCNQLDSTPSQVLRQMMRDFLASHNTTWS